MSALPHGSRPIALEDKYEEEGDAVPVQGSTEWIRGALIGSGSLGHVYLGMDAGTGLLMAVKQVERPKKDTPNAEHMKSMLAALELEIQVLRDLRHENIVQYLCACGARFPNVDTDRVT
jgi:mitogen-activated protein kinase kinase kinase